MAAKTYLITGGAGFIGAALVKKMVEEGYRIKVLDNISRGSVERLKEIINEIEFIEGDIRDAETVKKASKGMDGICHLAFVNGTEFFYSKPELVLEVGVKGMVNVIDACLDNNIGELILASSSEVYQTPEKIPTNETVPLSIPDPMNPRYSYAAGKIISEIMTLNYGRKYIDKVLIFRPHNVYGPNMGSEHVIPQFVARMKNLIKDSDEDPLPFPLQGTGKETRSFVFIDDFTDGTMRVIKKGEHMGLYHIGTEDEVEIQQVAKLVAEYFIRQIKIIPGESSRGGTLRRCPDISKMKTLGYLPKYSLKEGLAITTKWYDENIKNKP